MAFTKPIEVSIKQSEAISKLNELIELQNDSPNKFKEAFSKIGKASSLFKEKAKTNKLEASVKKAADKIVATNNLAEMAELKGIKAKAQSILDFLRKKKEEPGGGGGGKRPPLEPGKEPQSEEEKKLLDSTLGDFQTSGDKDWASLFKHANGGELNEEFLGKFNDTFSDLAKIQDDYKNSLGIDSLNDNEKKEYEKQAQLGNAHKYLDGVLGDRTKAFNKELENNAFKSLQDIILSFNGASGSKGPQAKDNSEEISSKFNDFSNDLKGLKQDDVLGAAKSLSGLKTEDDFNEPDQGKSKEDLKKEQQEKWKKRLELWNKYKQGAMKVFSTVNKFTKMFGFDIAATINYFKNALGNAVEEIQKMTKFNSEGRYTSLETEEEKAELGASSDAEFYAIKKAMDKLGMGKDEYFMGGVNEERSKALQELIEIEKANYEKLHNSGTLSKIEEAQKKWQDFKTKFDSMLMEFLASIMPVIVDALNAIMGILEPILNAVSGLFSLMKDETLTDEEVNKEINSMLNQYTQNTNNNNIAITNNMHSVNPGMSNRHQLEKAGQQNGVTVARALGY